MDGRNAVVVLTSNLGAPYIADPTLSPQVRRDSVMVAVRDAFKPEFLNRLDDVLVFDQLGRDDLTRIVDIQINRLRRRLADRRIALTVTHDALSWLADAGYDPVYGARPLRRLVQTGHGDQLARELLAGQIKDGDEVVVDLDERPSRLSVQLTAAMAQAI